MFLRKRNSTFVELIVFLKIYKYSLGERRRYGRVTLKV